MAQKKKTKKKTKARQITEDEPVLEEDDADSQEIPEIGRLLPDALAFGVQAIDPQEKILLEELYLNGLSLRRACKKAGIVYTDNSYRYARRTRNQAFIKNLIERQKIIAEFGVDDPMIVSLIRIRDLAEAAGQTPSAVRAHEIAMKSVGRLKADEQRPENEEKDIDSMSRDEVMDEIVAITSKAGIKVVDKHEVGLEEETEALRGLVQRADSPSPPSNLGQQINES